MTTIHLRSSPVGHYYPITFRCLSHISVSDVPDGVAPADVAAAANRTSIVYRDSERPTVAFDRLGYGRIVNLYAAP